MWGVCLSVRPSVCRLMIIKIVRGLASPLKELPGPDLNVAAASLHAHTLIAV